MGRRKLLGTQPSYSAECVSSVNIFVYMSVTQVLCDLVYRYAFIIVSTDM